MEHKLLILFGVLVIVATGIFNAIGAYVTKTIGGLGRSILDSARAFSVWMIGLLLNFTGQTYESADPKVISVKLVGFIIIICGTLVYNELVPGKKLRKMLGIKSPT